MIARTIAALCGFVLATQGIASADPFDGQPYHTISDCPDAAQYVTLVNRYLSKNQENFINKQKLLDRLIALGEEYHFCARGYENTRISDEEGGNAAQHRIAAAAAIVYYDAAQRLSRTLALVPASKRKAGLDAWVPLAHTAMVEAQYVQQRGPESELVHMAFIVDNIKIMAKKYAGARYDEVVELNPEDIRTH